MERTFLVLIGAVFACIGGMNLVDPAGGMAGFGLQVSTPSALNEIRANYGGMHLGMAGMFLAGAYRPELRTACLLLAATFMGGLVVGRVVGVLWDGSPNGFVWALLGVELMGSATAGWLVGTHDAYR